MGSVAEHLVVVPHTHWDREWYRTHEEFRLRLVRLLDGLLEMLDADPDFGPFTLDGQTIVLDDYLEVRPEARGRIEALVRAGRLVIGPWTVLPDEWLVSGEALVRNLRMGRERAEAFGGSLRLGYVPDQFGHVGQLPQILAGFGMEGAVLWRGVGGDVDRTLFCWEAPDGTRLLTAYLIHGYGNAAHLPLEPTALAARLRALIAAQKPHAAIPTLLLMNGSDHLEPQPGLPAALAAAAAELDGATVELGSLAGYFDRARREAEGLALPHHRGELRSGLRAPLLEGCASARLPQKRADFANDVLLTRYLEPLSAWLGELGGDPDVGILEHAWRIVLENHPHDSICGCSVDAVHDEMDVRFARVAQLARARLAVVTEELGSRVALPARGSGAGVVAWNPHGPGPALVEGEIEVEHAGRRPPRLHLRTAGGRRLPAEATVAAPGAELARYDLPGRVAALLVRGFPDEFTGLRPCGATTRRRAGQLEATIWLGEQQPPGFDFTPQRDGLVRAVEAEGDASVRYRVRRRPRLALRFPDALPGHGLRVYRLARGRAGSGDAPRAEARPGGGALIANEHWRVEADAAGRVRLEHGPSGSAVEDALRLVSEGDRGDEYTFDPVPGAAPVERPSRVRVRPGPRSEASACLALELDLRVPAALASGRDARSERLVRLPARVELRLWQGLDRLDLAVFLDNTAKDHRLRLHLRAPFAADGFEVESAFEAAERPIAPAADAFGPSPAELPTGATPQRSFASLRGAGHRFTVANRGAAEVEAVPEGDGTCLAVTLLRAVGWLSRDDLALRPGHAGPALETPGAQVPGPHRVDLALLIHTAADPARSADAHRFAAPPLAFAGGREGEGALRDGERLLAVDDPGVIVSALEPLRGGGSLVRLYEATGAPRAARVRFAGGPLEAVDLRGEPSDAVSLEAGDGGDARLALRPWQIACLRRRPR